MSNRIAVVPGSFDPPTRGHVDVIRRAAHLFDQVHVLVVHNPDKTPMLSVAERVYLMTEALNAEPGTDNVVVAKWKSGLLVDYAREVSAGVLVKGIRSQVDVAYETPMAIVNRHLADIETVFLLPDPTNALISSSLVRQVAQLGGDVSAFVPQVVNDWLNSPGKLS